MGLLSKFFFLFTAKAISFVVRIMTVTYWHDLQARIYLFNLKSQPKWKEQTLFPNGSIHANLTSGGGTEAQKSTAPGAR